MFLSSVFTELTTCSGLTVCSIFTWNRNLLRFHLVYCERSLGYRSKYLGHSSFRYGVTSSLTGYILSLVIPVLWLPQSSIHSPQWWGLLVKLGNPSVLKTSSLTPLWNQREKCILRLSPSTCSCCCRTTQINATPNLWGPLASWGFHWETSIALQSGISVFLHTYIYCSIEKYLIWVSFAII